MNSKQTIALISLCMCLVHAVIALPLMGDPQAPPANSLREAREAAQGADGGAEQSSSTTETDSGSVSTSSGTPEAETQSVCEPCTETAEELARRNVASGNILYPLSAMAETIHSERRKRDTESGASNVVHTDVCNDIISMANQNLPNDTQTPCPWRYTCSYHQDKFPHYILEANCLSDYCTYPCRRERSPATGPSSLKQCVKYSTTFSYLKLPENGCDGTNSENEIKTMTIAIGCACSR